MESNSLKPQSLVVSLTPFILIVATLTAYWPGLNGIFVLDDFHVLERLNEYGGVTDTHSLLQYIFNDKSGVTGRPISMLSFLVNDQYWPTTPWFYKYTNLLIHVLCGLCVWLLFYKISTAIKLSHKSSLIISGLTTTIWLLHPLNVSTTLYVVQRMTQLMSLFTLIGLLFFVHGRTILEYSVRRAIVFLTLSLLPFGLLSFLCKENGILIIFYILTLEYTLFAQFPRSKHYKIWLGIAIGTPILLLTGYFLVKWDSLSAGFYLRDFSQYQRILTEARILVTYIGHIFVPTTSGAGLFHDDITISTGLFSPITTLYSILFLIFTFGGAILFRKKYPIISFSVLWFYAGHLLESTFLNLELYYEHRNYLPMAGFIFSASCYLFIGFERLKTRKLEKICYATTIIVVFFLFTQTYKLATTWSTPALMFSTWAHEHPDSLRAQKMYAKHLSLTGNPESALNYLTNTSAKFTEDITVLLNITILACKYDIPTSLTRKTISARTKSARYSDGLLPAIEELINLHFQKQCATFSAQDLHSLLDELADRPTIKGRSRVMSKLLFLHANVYVKEGNLSQTMALLDQANKYSAGVSVPLYQAWLLGSAGLYKDAIEYLDMAERADTNREPLTPSRMQEISGLKEQYFKKLN